MDKELNIASVESVEKLNHLDITEGEEVNAIDAREAEVVKRILRKSDLWILPAVSLFYLLAVMDRANIGNAKIAGLQTDLGLEGTQMNTAISMFFVSYIVFQIPNNLLLKRLRPSVWLPTIIIIWSAAALGMGFVKNFGALVGCRLVLGAAEAGFTPGIMYYLTFWYTKKEIGPRMSLFFAAGTLSGVFGGPIAAGLSQITGGGLRGWQWIFVIEGIISIFLGILSYFYLPDYPETARFLNEKEKEVATMRLTAENAAAAKQKLSPIQIKKSFLDWKSYMYLLMFFAINMGGGTISVFLPSIITGLGYTTTNAQILSAVPNICALVAQLSTTYLSRVFARSWLLISFSAVGIVGFIVLISVHGNPTVEMFALCLASVGVFPNIPLLGTYMASNVSGVTKRGVVSGMTVMGSGIAGAIGAYTYRAQDAPNYILGHAINLAFLAVIIICALITRFYFQYANKKRDNLPPSEKDLSHLTTEEIENLCDDNPHTAGYKVGEKKTIEEYQNLDANDESLQKWKASLGLNKAVGGDSRRVIVQHIALEIQGRPDVVVDLSTPTALEKAKSTPFVIKEGTEYRMKVQFRIQNDVVSGLKYLQVVKRKGIRVDKTEEMIGSYGPSPNPYEKKFLLEEAPTGMLARGHYEARTAPINYKLVVPNIRLLTSLASLIFKVDHSQQTGQASGQNYWSYQYPAPDANGTYYYPQDSNAAYYAQWYAHYYSQPQPPVGDRPAGTDQATSQPVPPPQPYPGAPDSATTPNAAYSAWYQAAPPPPPTSSVPPSASSYTNPSAPYPYPAYYPPASYTYPSSQPASSRIARTAASKQSAASQAPVPYNTIYTTHPVSNTASTTTSSATSNTSDTFSIAGTGKEMASKKPVNPAAIAMKSSTLAKQKEMKQKMQELNLNNTA
ncbi:hypothetical protein BZG36_02360, partial [Bifiguratus adelaidae]